MEDSHSIVVASGSELRVGYEASCDVVLPKYKPPGARAYAIPSHYRDVARVSCTAEGHLMLTVITNVFSVYVSCFRILPSPSPVLLSPGCCVSFGKLSRSCTFRFFTARKCPATMLTLSSTSDLSSLDAPAQDPGNWAMVLPLFSLRDECSEQLESPRSPRVVQIAAPSKEDKIAVSLTTSDESHFSHGSEETSRGSPIAMYNESSHLQNDENSLLLCSAHVVVPFVVELWEQRATLHSIMGQCSTNGSENSQTTGHTTTTMGMKVECDSYDDPYLTSHGLDKMKCLRHLQFNTPVQSAAANVLEYIEDGYEPQEGSFLQFTERTKKQLLKHFSLLAEYAMMAMLMTPLTVRRRSPIVLCGDIHGSFADLKVIVDNVVPFRHWSLMTTPVLFLGDYVDRGLHDVEVILYLLAWYALCPENVILLRGNHEDEEINGDMEMYGELSFRKKCWNFFGEEDGEMFWKRVNDVFATLPVMAIIDESIFACHGGIPLLRCGPESCKTYDGHKKKQHKTGEDQEDNECTELEEEGEEEEGEEEEGEEEEEQEEEEQEEEEDSNDNLVQPEDNDDDDDDDIPHEHLLEFLMNAASSELRDVRFRRLMPVDNDASSTAKCRRLVRELLWNDPISTSEFSDTQLLKSNERGEEGEHNIMNTSSHHENLEGLGFRSNIGRGDSDNIIREFTVSALASFMQRWGFKLLIRAHQQKAAGLEMGFSGRILTLFSCCHYSGDTNKAGACIILNEEVHPISWRRSVLSRAASPKDDVTWRTAQHAVIDGNSLAESLWSSLDKPTEKIPVPSYVGLDSVRVG